MGQEASNKKVNLLIGSSGSVASTKVDLIVEAFVKTNNYNIKVVMTKDSRFFLKDFISNFGEFQRQNNVDFYYADDEFEYYAKEKEKTCPLFVKLSQWADILLIVPLSANTLGKIANGLCDNLLTHVVRCWDIQKVHFFNLAMNPLMYLNFTTKNYIKILTEEYKFIHIPSGSSTHKCGEYGIGVVADEKVLVDAIENVREKILETKKEIPIIRKITGQ